MMYFRGVLDKFCRFLIVIFLVFPICSSISPDGYTRQIPDEIVITDSFSGCKFRVLENGDLKKLDKLCKIYRKKR